VRVTERSRPAAEPRSDAVNLGARLDRKTRDRKLAKLQLELATIRQACLLGGHSAVIVCEGWDAAGMGGSIRRMSVRLDPRGLEVRPIAAPQGHNRKRPHLTRCFDRPPPEGAIAAFDRSWYAASRSSGSRP
jgi:polyphosphate kinase 2 (PPK2 family)